MELLRHLIYMKKEIDISIDRLNNKNVYVKIVGINELRDLRDRLIKLGIFIADDIKTEEGLIKLYSSYVRTIEYPNGDTNTKVDVNGNIILYAYINNDIDKYPFEYRLWVRSDVKRFLEIRIYEYNDISIVK